MRFEWLKSALGRFTKKDEGNVLGNEESFVKYVASIKSKEDAMFSTQLLLMAIDEEKKFLDLVIAEGVTLTNAIKSSAVRDYIAASSMNGITPNTLEGFRRATGRAAVSTMERQDQTFEKTRQRIGGRITIFENRIERIETAWGITAFRSPPPERQQARTHGFN